MITTNIEGYQRQQPTRRAISDNNQHGRLSVNQHGGLLHTLVVHWIYIFSEGRKLCSMVDFKLGYIFNFIITQNVTTTTEVVIMLKLLEQTKPTLLRLITNF